MYNNYGYSPQMSIDRINNQMAELEKMKNQLAQQPIPNINQTFQLAPSHQNTMRYVAGIEEVNKEMVIGDTPFFSKDLSSMWIKNAKGEVRTYKLTEIVPIDEKDIEIGDLKKQIEELRREIKNAKSNNDNAYESASFEEPESVSVPRASKKSKQS